MNGWLLLIPFLLIRFGLLALFGRNALARAAHFAPPRGRERIAYGVYQLSTAGILLAPAFLRVKTDWPWLFWTGIACYSAGLCLCAASVVSFAAPDAAGMNGSGLYRFSRNPMYVAYLICFLGIALLTRSLIFSGILLAFQLSAHWIIRSEERWCLERFGPAYRRYMERVRRYLPITGDRKR